MILDKYSLWSATFALWLIAESAMSHTVLAVIALVLFCGMTLLYSISRSKIKLKLPIVVVGYAIFTAVCYLGILMGFSLVPSQSRAIVKTLVKNLAFLVCLCVYISSIGVDRFRKVFCISVITASVLLVLYVLVTTGSLQLRGNDALNANVVAMCTTFAILLILTDETEVGRQKIIKLAVLLLVQLLAGTRKATIGLILGGSVLLLMESKKQLIINVLRIAIMAIVAYAVLMWTPLGYSLIGNRLESLIFAMSGGTADASAETRMKFIQLGWSFFLKSPVLGKGIDCFRSLSGAYGTYSHCNYIELLFGVGCVGTIAYYIAHVGILLGIRDNRTKAGKLALSLVLVLLFFDIGWVSYYSRIALTFIGLCYYLMKDFQEDDENESAPKSIPLTSPADCSGDL